MAVKANLIGIMLFLFINVIAFVIYFVGTVFLSNNFGDFTLVTLPFAYILVVLSGFVLIWPYTLEGNTWLARNVAGQNVFLDMMLEPGSFFTLRQLPGTDIDFKGADNNYYKIERENMVIRRGAGIPYMGHIYGKADPLDFKKYIQPVNAQDNTTYIISKIAQIKAKMFNELFDKIFLLQIAAIILIIIVGIGLYLVINSMSNNVELIAQIAKEGVKYFPTPIPGALPQG